MGSGGQVAIAGFVPGAIGQVVALHGTYYAAAWGFTRDFEAEVAAELGAFALAFDPARDGFWSASLGDRLVGSVAINGDRDDPTSARLRWFILEPGLQGQGLGGRLLGPALDFCRAGGVRRVVLWTFAGLDAARHLYERQGFRLSEEKPHEGWGPPVTAQRFDLTL